MDTLVVCVDRAGDISRQTGIQPPISGWEAVQALVLDVGLSDPEDSSVNSLLEALRITRDLHDGDEEATVAVVSGVSQDVVGADRAVAAQIDTLVERYEPGSVIVVVDSAEDERLVPIIESRVQVDSVDRVVVRQARDIESTYYLLKQFLADEELRETVLVPLGVVLLVFPALLVVTGSLALSLSAITAVLGLFLVYKGLGIDEYLETLPATVQDALYSGRVSIVTYVVGAGLAAIGVFAGALAVSDATGGVSPFLLAMTFAYQGVPWMALAALAASTGRLVDEAIQNDRIKSAYLNLPFGVVAVGLVVRGFSAYFLERAELTAPFEIPHVDLGVVTVNSLVLGAEQRLAVFVIAGVIVSLVGIRVSASLAGEVEPEGHAIE
jgi:putative membrane protein